LFGTTDGDGVDEDPDEGALAEVVLALGSESPVHPVRATPVTNTAMRAIARTGLARADMEFSSVGAAMGGQAQFLLNSHTPRRTPHVALSS